VQELAGRLGGGAGRGRLAFDLDAAISTAVSAGRPRASVSAAMLRRNARRASFLALAAAALAAFASLACFSSMSILHSFYILI